MYWTEEEVRIVKELRDSHMYEEISTALERFGFKRTAESIRCMLKRERFGKQKPSLNLDDMAKKAADELKQQIEKTVPTTLFPGVKFRNETLEEEYIEALKQVDQKREFLTGMTVKNFPKKGAVSLAEVKILCISDLHCPFHNSVVLAEAIVNNLDADVLVINGDFLDLYSVSSFSKNKEIPLRHEYKIALELLKVFSDLFPKVVLVSGNHEDRLRSLFAAQLNPNVNFMYSDDVLDKLANGEDINEHGVLEKKYDFDNISYEGGPLRWYTQIGKCIFAHPSHFSKITMRTATDTVDTLKEKENFQAMVIAHTHKQGRYLWKGKLVIEQGCCALPMAYEASARAKYAAQSFGYCVVYEDLEGNVDFNKTRTFYYGSEAMSKEYLNEYNN
ncbi:MAG: hypothetical protein DRI24_09485 [Deltaproteobacteria bacterium]|nr:MAG: hypothetical protein DRI24_09485 [Deltaproteobacteria bacterium]